MTILYKVHNNLYVNFTNKCPCSCTFCLRQTMDHVGESDSLWLTREPEYDEISVQMKDGSTYVIESKSQRVKNEFYGEYGKNNDLWIGFDHILDLEQVESVTINDMLFTVAD